MQKTIEKGLYRFLRLHDAIYQRTGGQLGHRIPGMPNSLLLHTVGAKTGKPRTSTLTYANDGDAYVIVGSNGGARRNPAWYHNLLAQPDVAVNVGPRRFPVSARAVLPGAPDYPRLWDLTNRNNRNMYRNYQAKTSRPIPVVVLTPR